DEIYAVKKGICYDYSSTLAGVLRSLGVPTRLVMGYKPKDIGDEYHAWNEILINGRWISVDSTFDAALAGVGRAYTIERKYKPDEINILRIY
ncbi:MAG: transglutaminase domain-containing protein, partial [Defluviitaleaceae bacterium]|nr:transglutaminase domain-containing protein [Defluviitaleaceae bacterium]